uniref:Uncharacterized protein n=1 Tax=Chromera velia CCMP2878 TaxID=1169474 RepID=A0A0K6S5Q1_9ALVE|eukprot:Cvel_14225.t2-p1 / transcript=Cvel_14225.t2 / gene=Cvel_14225 / organism=Chromera_velia_CCMP2878 / gene_product=none, putative / transcript_product=none, putative / location=Cvel_scaffold1003:38429-40000(+) / protein_length=524 / sequence_SO=supercontig / SO=protein_coding / is_pseudo=false
METVAQLKCCFVKSGNGTGAPVISDFQEIEVDTQESLSVLFSLLCSLDCDDDLLTATVWNRTINTFFSFSSPDEQQARSLADLCFGDGDELFILATPDVLFKGFDTDAECTRVLNDRPFLQRALRIRDPFSELESSINLCVACGQTCAQLTGVTTEDVLLPPPFRCQCSDFSSSILRKFKDFLCQDIHLVGPVGDGSPSTSNTKETVVHLKPDHPDLPDTEKFKVEVEKHESPHGDSFTFQTCRLSARSFRIVTTRTDVPHGWGQQLHVRWRVRRPEGECVSEEPSLSEHCCLFSSRVEGLRELEKKNSVSPPPLLLDSFEDTLAARLPLSSTADRAEAETWWKKIQDRSNHAKCYLREDFQAQARAVMPMSALSQTDGSPLEKTKVLCEWFKKDFFSWVNTLPCQLCGAKQTKNIGIVGPITEEEREGWASRVEQHKCTKCETITRFPRFQNPATLLRSRRGRCGALLFTFSFVLLFHFLSFSSCLLVFYASAPLLLFWRLLFSSFLSPCGLCSSLSSFSSPI